MDAKQFKQLIDKLEEIRCGIIDVETNTEQRDISTMISDLRQDFFNGLDKKTGWGKNEVKELFENAIHGAI